MPNPTGRQNTGQAEDLPLAVQVAVQAARDKKADDLAVLDLRPLESFTDYFVIGSGRSARQVQAIADAVEDALRKAGVRPAHVEGFKRAEWVLIDCFDVIVHVFNAERREFYALERLWGSAQRVELAAEAGRRP